MPILNTQLGGQVKDATGKLTNLLPQVALMLRGPILQVTITVEENVGKGLLAQGKPVPTPVSGMALIDTGATNTCIDDQAAQSLVLPIIDVARMTSATHANQQCNIYPVQINMPPNLTINAPRAMGAGLAAQGLLVLLGRDVLQACNLFYNGPMGQFTLSI